MEPAPESDDELMRRFCEGDEAAFARLYDRHASGVQGFLRRFVRDDALADDLLQTTFLSVVRGRGRYEPGTGVRPWIYAIAANAGRDALRRRRVRLDRPARDEDRLDDLPATEAALPDPAAARAIEAALERLPADQREAVLLHKLHGFSFPEIASTLGISLSAAKVRAHRGYEKLKRLLSSLEEST